MNEELLQPTPQPEQIEVNKEGEKEANLRLAFKQRDEEKKRREMAEMELMRLRQQQQQQQQQWMPQSPVREEEEPDDIYVDNRKFKSLRSETKALREENEAIKKQLEEMSQAHAESYIRTRYNDFQDMCSDENMERLARRKPEIYNSIMKNRDLRQRGDALYSAIRDLNEMDQWEQQKKKMADNRMAPKALGNVSPTGSESPLSQVERYETRISLSPEEAAEQRKKYLEARRRIR